MNQHEIIKMSSVEVINTCVGCASGTTGHTAGHTTGHTAGHTARSATRSLVDAHHDGVELFLEFLALVIKLFGAGILSTVNELEAVLAEVFNDLFVFISELVLHLFVGELILDLEAVVLKRVLGFDSALELVICVLVLFGFVHHLFDLVLAETTLIVSDGDFLGLS